MTSIEITTYRPDTLLNQQRQTSFSGSRPAVKTIASEEVADLIDVLNLFEVIASQVKSLCRWMNNSISICSFLSLFRMKYLVLIFLIFYHVEHLLV